MKKARSAVAEPEMLPEYDFTGAVRGKYFERYRQSSNVVVLDPDVSEAFPNSGAVNQALRALATVARRSASLGKRSGTRRRPNNALRRTSARRRARSRARR